MKSAVFKALLTVLILAFSTTVQAQPNCNIGIACGNTCISRQDTCRIGGPDQGTGSEGDTGVLIAIGVVLGAVVLVSAVTVAVFVANPRIFEPTDAGGTPSKSAHKRRNSVGSPPPVDLKPETRPKKAPALRSIYSSSRVIATSSRSPAIVSALTVDDVCTYTDRWQCDHPRPGLNAFRSSLTVRFDQNVQPLIAQAVNASPSRKECTTGYEVALPLQAAEFLSEVEVSSNGKALPSTWSIDRTSDPVRIRVAAASGCFLDLGTPSSQLTRLLLRFPAAREMVVEHSLSPVQLAVDELIPFLAYPDEVVPVGNGPDEIEYQAALTFIRARREAWSKEVDDARE